jgi:hypothetical protein
MKLKSLPGKVGIELDGSKPVIDYQPLPVHHHGNS